MLRWRTLIVLMMSLWLPVQGMAAVVMPFCKYSLVTTEATAQAVKHSSEHDAHAAHRHHGDHGQATHDNDSSANPFVIACDDCGQCALSAAYTLPTAGFQASSVLIAVPPQSISPALAGIVPHRLNRPPLLA
jgi:hypothetical protein